MHQRLYTVAFVIGLLKLVGCTSSCDSASSTVPKPMKKPAQVTSFPAVNVEKLTATQLEAFTRVANEEICTCSCPKTLAECLQTGTKCKSAQILASWIIDRLSEGMPPEYLQAVSKEIGLGYSGSPQMINLDNSHSMGAEKPKVTVVEFADFDCSHCRTTSPVLDAFVKKHADEVRFVYKFFPRGTFAGKLAAEAAEAASLQGKFWEMHQALFELDIITDEKIVAQANKIKLKLDKFNSDRKDMAVQQAVMNSIMEGRNLGLMATPTIFFNGRPYYLQMDMAGFEARLAMELAREESTCN